MSNFLVPYLQKKQDFFLFKTTWIVQQAKYDMFYELSDAIVAIIIMYGAEA